MIQKWVLNGVLSVVVCSSISFQAKADREDAGALLGAIVGGVIGNQIGGGDGKAIATGIGAIVGAAVGADVGRTLDEADRRAMIDAQRNAFSGPVGQRNDWDGYRYGSRTGSRGYYRTTRDGYSRYNTNQQCRSYESVVIIQNRTEKKSGVACVQQNGSWREVNSTEVIFNEGSFNQIRSYPPVDYDSLNGYCPDYDHSQFMQAKSFASSYEGLNIFNSEANDWAMNYNNSHRCNTIQEYSLRFKSLKELASSYDGLNLSMSESKQFALQKVDSMNRQEITEITQTVKKLKEFITNYDGLNKSYSYAKPATRSWIDRGYCENSMQIQMMWDRFKTEYEFAMSYNGLNLGFSRSKEYAFKQVSAMSRCSDLLM